MFGNKELIDRLGKIERRLNKVESALRQEVPAPKDYSGEFAKLQQEIAALRSEKNTVQEFRKSVKNFDEEIARFKKRTNGIADFERQLAERLSNQQTKLVEKKLAFVDGFLSKYHELERGTTALAQRVTKAQQELEKFSRIAATLKERDFALATQVKELKKRDTEIRRLERENEKLERLVARRRRN